MSPLVASAQEIVGLFITADKEVILWLASIHFFLALAVTALLWRRNKWQNSVLIFLTAWLLAFVLTHIFFVYIIEVPFLKFDWVSLQTD